MLKKVTDGLNSGTGTTKRKPRQHDKQKFDLE